MSKLDFNDIELIQIPAGTFLMGSSHDEMGQYPDEGPQHLVTVPEFWMGKYPITQAQYEAVMGENPSYFKGSSRPVERVSWHDAVAFCEKLSQITGRIYRLPSEAEWEYACRAGTTTPFYFGEIITPGLVNYNGNYIYGDGTNDVGTFPENQFGLHDMHGNVGEWCQDVWHDNYDGAPADGSAWVEGGDQGLRVLRGGSWCDVPDVCKSAVRIWLEPTCIDSSVGFRVVCGGAR
jgi:formylglycine-generating enzyme required for sulfatase activity